MTKGKMFHISYSVGYGTAMKEYRVLCFNCLGLRGENKVNYSELFLTQIPPVHFMGVSVTL